jgi:hypothetical protein
MCIRRHLPWVLLALAASIHAQTRDTAAIFGSVRDTQNAIIPGVTITLTSTSTGQARSTVATESGEYGFNLLPVGGYTLSVEQPSFKRYQRTGILLQANENVKLDISLEVGDVKTTVSVSEAVSQIETRSATIKETVDQARIVELPLDGRNPADLALLVPGVVPGSATTNGDATYDPIIRGQKSFSIGGSRNNNVRFSLDGGENMDSLFNFNAPFPFPDAVEEFSVQTSNMMLDQGNSSAGAINVVTKSGTNQYHGNAFWFVRNTDLNARNFFSHEQDSLKRNQLGYTVGGPILKNKLFAFGGSEKLWLRQAPGDLKTLSIPETERNGNFSAAGVPIYDPLNGQPFPGNIIPTSRLSPAALNLLAITPLPDPDGYARFSYPQTEGDWSYIFRLDYVINAKNNLMFRYFGTSQDEPYHSPDNNIDLVQLATHNFSRNATVSYNFVASPNLIAHTQLSGEHLVTNGASDLSITIANLGVQVYAPSNDISVFLLNSGINMTTPPKIYFARAMEELLHDWTWTKGAHTFTWGTQLAWSQYNENTIYDSSGNYQFDGEVTGHNGQPGLDVADFMLGQMSYFTQNNGELENRRQFTKGLYFADVWRVTPRFTVSAGLRYEPYSFFTDTKKRNQTFSPENYAAGIKSQIYLNAPPGLLYPGDKDPSGGTISNSVMKPDLTNFAPRLGFAWDPFGDGKTSIRTGYGIYYNAPQLAAENNSNDVAPFSYRVQFDNGLFDSPYLGRESANVYPVTQFVADTPFQSPLATILLDNKYRTAYSQNWSFTIERQVIRDTRLRVGYVGTKATHLDGDYDENAPIYNFNISYDDNLATINQRRPYQGYQSIAREFFGLNSSYNALQVSVDKRFSQGFTILSSYTWSKTLDYVSQNNYAGNLIENSFDFFFARGLSDQNRPQTFVNSFVWDLPSPGGANVAPVVRALTRDWKLSGIISLFAGTPFSIQANGDVLANTGESSANVNLIGAGNPVTNASSKGQEVAEYFNIARFANPAPGTYGNLGRNALQGPGFSNVDVSLVKGFRIPLFGEAGLGQFRFEAFNVLNRTNFANPNTNITSPSFGQLTSTAGDPRILQLALKFAF